MPRKYTKVQLRKMGLCTTCGKKNPTPDKCRCPECTERENDQRRLNKQYLKLKGICVSCGSRQAEPQKVLCMECAGAQSDKYFAKKLLALPTNKSKRMTEERRKLQGVCYRCGKRKPTSERSMCSVCKAKAKAYRDSYRQDISRSERPLYNRCYICGTSGLYKHFSLCQKCYEKRLKTVPKMLNADGHGKGFRETNSIFFLKKGAKYETEKTRRV